MKVSDLVKYMESELNVLLSGSHGVGKTMMIMQAAKEAAVELKYYSAATLDPWADLVGIPVPVGDDDNKHLKFIRPKDVENAEIVFFDELNRSHPKVQNAVLEMIQFHSINGVKLPKLKMVWAAINPAGSKYKVDELDPALLDRFHIHQDVKPNPSKEYFTKDEAFSEEEAEALVGWWHNLPKDQKILVSPRRLEYFGILIKEGIHPRNGLPLNLGVNVPVADLMNRFNKRHNEAWNIDQIIAAKTELFQMHISDQSKALEVAKELISARVTFLATSEGLPEKILMLPKEVRQKLYSNSSFRAKIQSKYKSSWTNNCPPSIRKILVDSNTLSNKIVDLPNLDKDGIILEKEVDGYRDQIIKARKKLKEEIVDLTPPKMKEETEEMVNV